MASWAAFWDRPHSIYVNETHLRAHFERLGRDTLALLPLRGRRALLDFGCGDALAAPRFAQAGWRVHLYDASPETRRRLAARYGGNAQIVVLDEAGLAALGSGSMDAILASSVVQYVPRPELPALLARWCALLAPEGHLLVADVVTAGGSALVDAASLLSFARAHGFLGAALLGLVRTFFSDYRRLRRELGLASYGAEEFLALLSAAGFTVERLPANPGPSPHRLAFLGHPA
ncbi:MAG: class I SAM-dependent methyltransferase [Alphaproteobacteria bacterium]|nr:class I SAM-dependent methyltransferase [Alphaproteobacteria bacterium]